MLARDMVQLPEYPSLVQTKDSNVRRAWVERRPHERKQACRAKEAQQLSAGNTCQHINKGHLLCGLHYSGGRRFHYPLDVIISRMLLRLPIEIIHITLEVWKLTPNFSFTANLRALASIWNELISTAYVKFQNTFTPSQFHSYINHSL